MPLYLSMFKTFHALRNKTRVNMAEWGLSPGQPKVLRYILHHPGCMLKEIALSNDVESATVSKIVNDLEIQGMIKKEAVKQNRRAMQITITDLGREAIEKWDIHCLEIEKEAFSDFSDEEKQQFQESLGRIYHNLTGKVLK